MRNIFSITSIISIIALSLLLTSCSHPKDLTLAEHLLENEVDFNRLVSMFNEDVEFSRITSTFTTSNIPGTRPKLPEERWNEYRRLFKKLDLKYGIGRFTKADATIMYSAWGMATGGTMKGYAYSTKELTPLVDSLDDPSSLNLKSLQPGFKKIKGNWYLYYMWDD